MRYRIKPQLVLIVVAQWGFRSLVRNVALLYPATIRIATIVAALSIKKPQVISKVPTIRKGIVRVRYGFGS
jgi:hypothetical protein